MVGSPGRIAEYRHLEADFEYAAPVFTPMPAEAGSPEKRRRVENRAAWRRFHWKCDIGCRICDPGYTPSVPEEALVGTKGSGKAKDKDLTLLPVDRTCKTSCKLKCSTVFPFNVRENIRELRHKQYSTGILSLMWVAYMPDGYGCVGGRTQFKSLLRRYIIEKIPKKKSRGGGRARRPMGDE